MNLVFIQNDEKVNKNTSR